VLGMVRGPGLRFFYGIDGIPRKGGALRFRAVLQGKPAEARRTILAMTTKPRPKATGLTGDNKRAQFLPQGIFPITLAVALIFILVEIHDGDEKRGK
jgi:hypothetical protein